MSKPVLLTVATAILGFVSTTTGAIAADRAPEGTVASAASVSAKVGPKTRYCVVDTLTGSRIPTKQCRTRDDWLKRGFDPIAK